MTNYLDCSQSIVKKYEEYCGKNNIPGGRKTPYFRNENVLDESFLGKVRNALASIPGKMRPDGVLKDYVWFKMAQVEFDSNYQAVATAEEWEDPVSYYRPEGKYSPPANVSETISTLRATLLQQFARELNLTGTHRIWMNCFGYKLKDGQSAAPLPWHDDENNNWTGVTLLTDPNAKCGWTGGNLQLAPAKTELRTDGSEVELPITEELVEIPSKFNCTIFFHNYGTKHTVTPMTGRIDHQELSKNNDLGEVFSERIIFCIEDHCQPNCRHIKAKQSCCIIS